MRSQIVSKIKFLSQYNDLCKEYKELIDAYKAFLHSMVDINAQILSDMPKGTSKTDIMANKMAKLEALEQGYNEKTAKLIESRHYIESIIDGIESPAERRLLRMRYIEGMKWERICVNLHYSWKQIHRKHIQALLKISL